MKLPFINRRKYVLIEAYTDIKRYVDDVPLMLTKDYKPTHLNARKLSDHEKRTRPTFNTCHGRISGLRNSITYLSISEHLIQSFPDRIEFEKPDLNKVLGFEVQNDPTLRPNGVHVVKGFSPWFLQCNNKDVHFVFTSHMLNTTGVPIVTGVATNNGMNLINYFMYVSKQRATYHIPFKMPLLQIFPLTDLPIHLEVSLDRQKVEEVQSHIFSRPYFVSYNKKDKE